MGAKLAMMVMALATGFLAGRLDATRQAAPAEPPAAQRVAGIGGVFFKARDPDALSAWYRDHLGLEVGGKTRHHVFLWRHREDQARPGATVWALFPHDTKYFGPSQAPFMINYRVADLEAMLAQLRRHGVAVDGTIAEEFNGRFSWISDPEGNRIELWEPKAGF